MKPLLWALLAAALVGAPELCHAQDATQATVPDDAPDQDAAAASVSTDDTQGTTGTTGTPTSQTGTNASEGPTLENTIAAGESEEEPQDPRGFTHWNEYEGPYFTIRASAGVIYDTSAYVQDEESKEQIALSPDEKLRDFRFLLRGRFPSIKRTAVTWSSGIMYDAPTHSWLVRETGVMVALPKSWGYLFVGRTKTGFSLNKVMVGYAGWTMERATMNDATIPILGDGVKWLGYNPKYGFMWNVGWYNDFLSKTQKFNLYHTQVVARLAWLPIHSDLKKTLLHLGANLLYGTPEQGEIDLRSRPESFPAPYFVDTGKFQASETRMAGYEIYFRDGPWLFGSEYWWDKLNSKSTGSPVFNGGDVVATWIITGETREYNTVGGFFKAVAPRRPVFQGGPGAWEVVARFSNIDLNGGTLSGGRFWRFTPMVNWYLSSNVRLELAYGYGHLDRFNLAGNTQFFQSRIQVQF
jgi:phosphate-selective porin OprO and OprP